MENPSKRETKLHTISSFYLGAFSATKKLKSRYSTPIIVISFDQMQIPISNRSSNVQKGKKVQKFLVFKCWMPRDKWIEILILKISNFFSCKFVQFLVIKILVSDWVRVLIRIRICIQPKIMLGPDPESVNPDPKYC